MTSLETFIREKARSLGFDECQITGVGEQWEAGDQLERFVSNDYHGNMRWMETTLDRRKHPTRMWADAKSAIVVGLNYKQDSDPLKDLDAKTKGNISVYAQGDDYHDVIKKKLKILAREFADKSSHEVKVFVDTAPLMEKPLAQRAGVGWQGKHTNLVSKQYGSWLFLGTILTSATLISDDSEKDHCGSCTACLDICPTEAFVEPYKIDARRCISYLTIEHKGLIPEEFRKPMGNRIYGCDDCLAVCPWNKFAQEAHEVKLKARKENALPDLVELSQLTDTEFRSRFSKSPIKRIGVNRFLRNVLIALGNSEQQEAGIKSVISKLDEEDHVVRGTAVWALSRLDPHEFQKERERRLKKEKNKEVQIEWTLSDRQPL